MVLMTVLILSFTYVCPVFLPPFIEETIFSIEYSCLFCNRLGNHSAWVYLLAFYPVPLIYISVLMLVSYRFNDCSLAI